MKIETFESRDALADALAQRVVDLLRARVEDGTSPLLRVSGGSTPLPLFRALARAELDWSRVRVGLVDERWVPTDDPASNERFVRGELLAPGTPGAEAHFVGLADAARPVDTAPTRWAEQLEAGLPDRSEVLILGMGGDGHFASLFPGMPGLEAAFDLAAAPGTLSALAPSEPRARVSLNLSAIAAAEHLFLHITGSDKRELLDRALAGDPEVASLPIATLVAQLGAHVTVYWAP